MSELTYIAYCQCQKGEASYDKYSAQYYCRYCGGLVGAYVPELLPQEDNAAYKDGTGIVVDKCLDCMDWYRVDKVHLCHGGIF